MLGLLRKRPLLVIMDVTERCNLKCRMCYFSATDRLQFKPFDRTLSSNGLMPIDTFERIADDLFPRAWRVALGCAAEPLIHPQFIDLLHIAGRYRVKDLWFPTNLLALTPKKAEAICENGVGTVGVSIDGTAAETYETIRVGGKWSRLVASLELLNRVRGGRHGRTKLRIIFTWMKTNFEDLRELPRFAEEWGANELDVRFVAPTAGVDNGPELLDGEDPAKIRAALSETARDAVGRGLRLASYPDYETAEELPHGWWGRARRSLWRFRAGLDRLEYARFNAQERLNGCVWPANIYVVRPNGAVSPCIFWEETPIGFYPEDEYAAYSGSEALGAIRQGLRSGQPVGTCKSCSQRKDALYYRLKRWAGRGESGEETPEVVQLGKPH